MITEYTETFLNPLPFQKWFIKYNAQTYKMNEELSFQTDTAVAMNIPKGMIYATFDSKKEGETYIKDKNIITINRYIEIDEEE